MTARGAPRASWRSVVILVSAFRLLARRAPVLVHPTPQSLVRYRAGELSPEREQEIQEHFLFCPLCPDLLLDIGLFSAPPPPGLPPPGPDSALAAAWQALRARLAAVRRKGV